MKNYMIGIMFVIACGTGGCEKDTFHDTGLANGVYDGTAWEYMQAGHGNWDSLVIMIRKAGLADLFDGKDPDCPQMTVAGDAGHRSGRHRFPLPGIGSYGARGLGGYHDR